MWLMYPPLASKHLQVTPVVNDPEFAFDVVAMGKEVVRVVVNNQVERDAWVQHLHETIEFGLQRKTCHSCLPVIVRWRKLVIMIDVVIYLSNL